MDDKQIKQLLKDASLYLSDAAKAWPRYPEVAEKRFGAAMRIVDDLYPYFYDNRPMGGEE